MIGGLKFEQYREREVAVRVGLTEDPHGVYPFRLGRWPGSDGLVSFVNIIYYQGVIKLGKECKESCAVTRLFQLNRC